MTPPLMNWSKVWKTILVKIFLFHSRYQISSHLCGHMFFDSKVGLTRHSKHQVKTEYIIGIHKNHFTRQWRLLQAHFITQHNLQVWSRNIKFNIENNKTDYFQMSCRISFMVLLLNFFFYSTVNHYGMRIHIPFLWF